MLHIEKILNFSGLPTQKYPNNIVDSDKVIFDYHLSQKIPRIEVKFFNNVWVSPYGIIYKNFSILKECTPYYYEWNHGYVTKFTEKYINSGGKLFGGSIERFVRHFILFKRKKVNETCFWCSDHYSEFYMHWLGETLPRIYLLSLLDFDCPKKVILPGPTTKNVSFIKQSLDLLFPNIQFSFTENRNVLDVKELVWISQMGKPSHQFNPPLMASFREFIRSKVIVYHQSPKKRLYVSRKNAASRKVSNEYDVQKLLKKFNFDTICFEDYNFEEQVRICSQSEIIIGIHGAGLTNIIFLPDNAFVLELQRRMNWSTCFYSLANALDLNYHYLFCEPDSEELDLDGREDNVNLHVDLSALERIVEKMVIAC